MAEHSIVEFIADHSGSSCGYCGSSRKSYSHGLWCSTTLLLSCN